MRSSVGWLLSVLLFLALLFVVLFPLGGIDAITEYLAIRDDQYFLVENAAATEPAQHAWLRRAVEQREPFEPLSERTYRIHRIAPGEGTVIGWRYAYDHPRIMDEERRRKITIFIPGPIPQGETVITLGAGGTDRANVVESSESLAWGPTCLGIARSGTIRLVREGHDHVDAAFDFTVERIAEVNVLRPSEVCPNERYQATATLDIVRYRDLTPWQGKAEGEVDFGERWPGGES